MPGQLKDYGSQIVLALLSGILLALAFPKIDIGWLAWVALAPLLLAIRQVSPKPAFFIGFTFGLVHAVGLVYWTVHTMHTYGNIPVYQAVFLMILLAGYLALYPGLFTAALAWLRPKPGILTIAAPSLWVALEMVRNSLFTGFPWELLGYSQYKYLWVIQISDMVGVFGISGLIVFANAVVAVGLLHWLELPWQNHLTTKKGVIRCVAALLTVMAATIGYGIRSMGVTDRLMASAEQARVAVIQGNIDQAQKWDPRFQVLTTVKYRQHSLNAAARKADLIIWPETAAPFYLLDDKILTEMVMEGIKKTHAFFIIGSPSHAADDDQLVYHNSAFLISPEGKLEGKYDKVHLVPFGEYVPLKRFLPFIDKLVAQVGDFKSGRRGSTLSWDGHHAGMLICYEAIFPELAAAMVRNGADLLVNITNDAWFGHTSAAYQHFSMAAFRAVENRRYLARAANTGISGFVDANGRIIHPTPLFKDAVVVQDLALLTSRSFYNRWGNWPLGLFTTGLVLIFIGRRWRRLKPG